MINRSNVARIRKYATREMMFDKSCEHAVYGISYEDFSGKVVNQFANSPEEIRYFSSDEAYEDYKRELMKRFVTANFKLHAIHKEELLYSQHV